MLRRRRTLALLEVEAWAQAAFHRLLLRRTTSGFARQRLGIHARLGALAPASVWLGNCEARAISDKNPTTTVYSFCGLHLPALLLRSAGTGLAAGSGGDRGAPSAAGAAPGTAPLSPAASAQSPAQIFVPLTVPTSLHPIGVCGFGCALALPAFGGGD